MCAEYFNCFGTVHCDNAFSVFLACNAYRYLWWAFQGLFVIEINGRMHYDDVCMCLYVGETGIKETRRHEKNDDMHKRNKELYVNWGLAKLTIRSEMGFWRNTFFRTHKSGVASLKNVWWIKKVNCGCVIEAYCYEDVRSLKLKWRDVLRQKKRISNLQINLIRW